MGLGETVVEGIATDSKVFETVTKDLAQRDDYDIQNGDHCGSPMCIGGPCSPGTTWPIQENVLVMLNKS
jgi:hypothetical protein